MAETNFIKKTEFPGGVNFEFPENFSDYNEEYDCLVEDSHHEDSSVEEEIPSSNNPILIQNQAHKNKIQQKMNQIRSDYLKSIKRSNKRIHKFKPQKQIVMIEHPTDPPKKELIEYQYPVKTKQNEYQYQSKANQNENTSLELIEEDSGDNEDEKEAKLSAIMLRASRILGNIFFFEI